MVFLKGMLSSACKWCRNLRVSLTFICFFYWSIIVLPCCVSFCCQWSESATCVHMSPPISHMCTCVSSHQPCVYICLLPLGPPSHLYTIATPLGHHTALSRASYTLQQVPTSCLVYTWQCMYVSTNLPICSAPLRPCVQTSLLYTCFSIPVLQIGSSVLFF